MTFATGKGIAVREHSDARHDSAARNQKALRLTKPIAVANPAVQSKEDALQQGTLGFDPAGVSSRFLRLTSPTAISCHANCSQSAQGTAFLTRVRAGDEATLKIRCTNKPGRMRYFIGCAPARFDLDSGQTAIATASYSLENLKAGPNRPGKPCGGSAPPCFHTSSVITMRIDLRSSPGMVRWQVDSTGVNHAVSVDAKTTELHPFVSLYNREALFELIQE